jgi:DNA-binding NarL/FixJ family response regulator
MDKKPRTVKVLVADDHDVVRKGVRAILEAREGWTVCGEAATGMEAVELAIKLKPDVVVLDLEMRDLDGLTATRQIKQRQPQIQVLVFTVYNDEILLRDVLEAGATGYVLKSEGGTNLIRAIESAMQHAAFFTPRTSETLLNSFLKVSSNMDDRFPLTSREREVVRLLASGSSNKEAAVSLGISVKTVETHRAAIMRKLGFSSIVTLVRYAVREHLIKA